MMTSPVRKNLKSPKCHAECLHQTQTQPSAVIQASNEYVKVSTILIVLRAPTKGLLWLKSWEGIAVSRRHDSSLSDCVS